MASRLNWLRLVHGRRQRFRRQQPIPFLRPDEGFQIDGAYNEKSADHVAQVATSSVYDRQSCAVS